MKKPTVSKPKQKKLSNHVGGRRNPFAECQGILYMRIKDTGIHPLCLLIDGAQMVTFGKEKTHYLTVQQAIDWHEKEVRDSMGKSGSQKIADVLKGVLAIFAAQEASKLSQQPPPC